MTVRPENPSAQGRAAATDAGHAVGETSLDPTDWAASRAAGHQIIDDMFDLLEGAREGRVWTPPPDETRAALDEPVPHTGMPIDKLYDMVREHVVPYRNGNIHPRFFGWVMGTGTVEGMLADLIASGTNPHLAGYDQSASLIESKVIDWFKSLMGYPDEAGGLFVSGGTMANLIGVVVARNALAAHDVRNDGLDSAPKMTLYGSTETHSWAEKAADIIGLGRGAVRRVASDAEGRVDVEALAAKIAHDRAQGEQPFCVIANVGTVDGGAIDDLDSLADFCGRESLWLHVDGAFGAMLALAPTLKAQVASMRRADSIAFDVHKWGYLQYEIGGVLIRDAKHQRDAFSTQAAYLTPAGRGVQPEALHFAEMGPQLSRGFRALRAWMSLKHHGADKIGRVIEQNVAQAQHLASRIRADAALQLFEPSGLNIICFRYLAEGRTDSELDNLNREILLQIQESGLAVPSSTVREGCFCLRVAITNHRTRLADMDLLADAVLEHGRALTGA